MITETGLAGIAHVIQLAVAPVFLLTGIGAILAVMTSRLARIIDRARQLEGEARRDRERHEALRPELTMLCRRARLASRAIALCTVTALLVCAVVALLFLGVFLGFDASVWVALLFIGAMLAFFLGLVCFLWEVWLGTSSLRIGIL